MGLTPLELLHVAALRRNFSSSSFESSEAESVSILSTEVIKLPGVVIAIRIRYSNPGHDQFWFDLPGLFAGELRDLGLFVAELLGLDLFIAELLGLFAGEFLGLFAGELALLGLGLLVAELLGLGLFVALELLEGRLFVGEDLRVIVGADLLVVGLEVLLVVGPGFHDGGLDLLVVGPGFHDVGPDLLGVKPDLGLEVFLAVVQPDLLGVAADLLVVGLEALLVVVQPDLLVVGLEALLAVVQPDFHDVGPDLLVVEPSLRPGFSSEFESSSSVPDFASTSIFFSVCDFCSASTS